MLSTCLLKKETVFLPKDTQPPHDGILPFLRQTTSSNPQHFILDTPR